MQSCIGICTHFVTCIATIYLSSGRIPSWRLILSVGSSKSATQHTHFTDKTVVEKLANMHSHVRRPHFFFHNIRAVPTTTTTNIVATERKHNVMASSVHRVITTVYVPAAASTIPAIQSAAHKDRFCSAVVVVDNDVTTKMWEGMSYINSNTDRFWRHNYGLPWFTWPWMWLELC